MAGNNPVLVGVGGIASNVGKTTLMCELLSRLPGWEAIKTTRGHYRSCGKDPSNCCVSHLLSTEPIIFSGKEETYEFGKDTGRYWDAGAANVHWVIASSAQVGEGIRNALERVNAPGVLIEGNSFSEFVQVDLMIMVATHVEGRVKSSSRRALRQASILFTSRMGDLDQFAQNLAPKLPEYNREDLPRMIDRINELGACRVGQQT